MEIIQRVVDAKRPLAVAPIGDIQFGNEGCDEELLADHLAWVLKRFKGCEVLFVGTGDYIDPLSPSNREAYASAKIYDSSRALIEERVGRDLVKDLAKILKPTKKRWATFLHGHHFMTFSQAPFSSDHLLAELLEGEATSHDCVVLELSYGKRVRRLVAAHGDGAGRTTTYMLRKLEQWQGSWDDIDAILAGHTHVAGAIADARINVAKRSARAIPLVNTGSYLRAYIAGKKTYPEKWFLSPRALGGGVILWDGPDAKPEVTIRWG